MSNAPKTITIPYQEYKDLVDAGLWLDALDTAGVDNWEGISVARDIYEELKDGIAGDVYD